jgi:hypothetical protein
VSVNRTLVEDKIRRFKGECAHLRFNKGPIYIHDGASAKFSTNSHETDNSASDHIQKLPYGLYFHSCTMLSGRSISVFLIIFLFISDSL